MQIESVGQAGRALILYLSLGLGPLRCGGSGGAISSSPHGGWEEPK